MVVNWRFDLTKNPHSPLSMTIKPKRRGPRPQELALALPQEPADGHAAFGLRLQAVAAVAVVATMTARAIMELSDKELVR